MSHASRDRRRSVRLRATQAKAVCSAPHADGLYQVCDLSRGGALIEGKSAVAPGTKVSLRMLVPGVDPMTLGGRIIRESAGTSANVKLAVKFTSVSPDDEDRFADLIAREWSKVCAPRCIVAASCLHMRMELTRRIGTMGMDATRASSPIELIHRLEEAGNRCVVAFLGSTLGGCTGLEIASFLALAYPSVRRVLVMTTRWVEGVPVPESLHGVLEPPWREAAIEHELRSARQAAASSVGNVERL